MPHPETLPQQIEKAIHERRLDQVKKLVAQLTSEQKQSPASRLQASEYYRRISDFSSALRVLHSELEARSWRDLSESEVLVQLQLARVLNLLGASSYALRIIERVQSTSAPRAKFEGQLGGILISNYRYAEALPYFESADKLSDAELGYPQRLRLISLADCLFGTGDLPRARSVIERVLRSSQEPLILGIAYQALGSYELLSGQVDPGTSKLEKSLSHFGPADATLDRGFLEKWLGASLCLRKRHREAAAQLEKAWRLLYRPGYKPEAWLEIYYWQGLNRFLEDGKFPSEWVRLLAYPGPGNRLAARIRNYAEIPSHAVLDLDGAREEPAVLHFDSASDLRIELKRKARTYHLGLDLPEQLLSLLVGCGKAGIPQYRAYESLWPEEVFSFSQHQKRVEQVILRLRKKKIPVTWEHSHLSCSAAKGVSSGWLPGPRVPGGLFLTSRVEFQRTEVEEFFAISRRSAAYLCEQWETQGLVVKSAKKGPLASYLVLEHNKQS